MPSPLRNALSVDLEDWFCVQNLSGVIGKEDWDSCELRVVENTRRLLETFERHQVRATFFVLGWIAEKAPDLIREIESHNHEIAAHGYQHTLLTDMTPEEFEADLIRTLDVLKRCGIRQEIVGYRAPSFTLVRETLWILPILEKHGFRYDSSIFPVAFHPDYGLPEAPLTPYWITEKIREFPLSCMEFLSMRLPCCGGGYFRLLPYGYTKYGIRACNNRGNPVVFYIHPWEIDPAQPRIALPRLKAFRHYFHLGKTQERLERLLTDFQFTTIEEILNP